MHVRFNVLLPNTTIPDPKTSPGRFPWYLQGKKKNKKKLGRLAVRALSAYCRETSASAMSTFATPGIRAFGDKKVLDTPGVVAQLVRNEFGAVHSMPCIVWSQYTENKTEACLAPFLATEVTHPPGRPDTCQVSGHWLLDLQTFREVHPGFENDSECKEQLDPVFGEGWLDAERDDRLFVVDLASKPVLRNMNEVEWYVKVTTRPPARPWQPPQPSEFPPNRLHTTL